MGYKKINPLFKLLGIRETYSKFDSVVGKIGWLKGCKWLIHNLKIGIEFQKIKTNGATIIYANHPTGLDPYLLTAILSREDSYFWGDIYQSKKGTNISKHIIPIAPKPFSSILRRPLTNWPGYIYMRLTTSALNREDTKAANKNSIDRTIKLLKSGKQIIIFPSGGEYEFIKPAKGLQIVVQKCNEQEISVKIIKLKIENFGELSLLFHFLFKIKIKAKITKV